MTGQILCAVLLVGLAGATTLTVGEGEQFATPQQAIDAVSDGDTILIRAGTYEFNDSIELRGHNDIWIIGQSGYRLICDTGSRLICNSQIDNVMWISNCDRITVSGLRATHTEPAEDQRCYGNVFVIDGCNDITIENCEINGCGAIGVYTNLVDGIVLRNNYIHDNTICAVLYYGQNLMMESNHLEGLTMEGNTILNNGGRRVDMLYCAGSHTGELAGVTNEDGYLKFIFSDPMYGDIDTCYVVPGCEGPWLEISLHSEEFIGSILDYSFREVEAYFLVYCRSNRIMEMTSVSIPD
ncbi:MAG: right-handed parallel beta-helix repeat-containing protein [Candidatus Aegiribacteria sp.]|nr:right-handed parallel beta-helix repeat-containing protein [Candidatus Aegiribacteria sp.]